MDCTVKISPSSFAATGGAVPGTVADLFALPISPSTGCPDAYSWTLPANGGNVESAPLSHALLAPSAPVLSERTLDATPEAGTLVPSEADPAPQDPPMAGLPFPLDFCGALVLVGGLLAAGTLIKLHLENYFPPTEEPQSIRHAYALEVMQAHGLPKLLRGGIAHGAYREAAIFVEDYLAAAPKNKNRLLNALKIIPPEYAFDYTRFLLLKNKTDAAQTLAPFFLLRYFIAMLLLDHAKGDAAAREAAAAVFKQIQNFSAGYGRWRCDEATKTLTPEPPPQGDPGYEAWRSWQVFVIPDLKEALEKAGVKTDEAPRVASGARAVIDPLIDPVAPYLPESMHAERGIDERISSHLKAIDVLDGFLALKASDNPEHAPAAAHLEAKLRSYLEKLSRDAATADAKEFFRDIKSFTRRVIACESRLPETLRPAAAAFLEHAKRLDALPAR